MFAMNIQFTLTKHMHCYLSAGVFATKTRKKKVPRKTAFFGGCVFSCLVLVDDVSGREKYGSGGHDERADDGIHKADHQDQEESGVDLNEGGEGGWG